MIIPPDDEKDANLFRTTSVASTSLVPPPSDPDSLLIDIDAPARPPAVLRASYPFSDWHGEDLPPYERARWSAGSGSTASLERHASRAASSSRPSPSTVQYVFADPPSSRRRPLRPVISTRDPESPTPSPLPTPVSPEGTVTPTLASASKLWEGSALPPRHRTLYGWPLPVFETHPPARRWWRKYRRWLQALSLFILVAIGLTVGLLVGFRAGFAAHKSVGADDAQPTYEVSGGASHFLNPNLNLTYVPSRDGPDASDGRAFNCNAFAFYNTSSDLDQLAIPYAAFDHVITNYSFPLASVSGRQQLDSFFMVARGLAATGTVEFVGTDGPSDVISGGDEDNIRVDVVVRYAEGRNLSTIMNICQMRRDDGSVGVGIFTPVETDGGISNPYLLNVQTTPSYHVVVRLPPSAVKNPVYTYSPVYIPDLAVNVSQMAVRTGNMQGVVDFGNWSISTCRGGVVTVYVAAQNAIVSAGGSSVQGKFNVSESLVVNGTSGTIMADVILWDSQNPGENSTTLESTFPVARRAANAPVTAVPANVLTAADPSTPERMIHTSFTSNEGFIYVSYLHHPPSVALSSYITSSGGTVDVSVHPNFVGAFAIQNLWGEVRLPPVSTGVCVDPVGEGRRRAVVQGNIDVSDGTLFATEGINSTTVALAEITVTGAAYWADVVNGQAQTQSAHAVQDSAASGGSELVVVGSWGDVQVTFDGT
ncbi:hypothetical protein Q5752_004646 [Cryptotrichosporon argae]